MKETITKLLKYHLQLFLQPEAFPVVRGDAVTGNGSLVKRCGISFVAFPAIFGESEIELYHVLIPVGFGQHRCGSYGLVESIAAYNTLMWDLQAAFEPVTVDQ